MTEDYSAYATSGHNQPEEIEEITRLAEAQHKAALRVEVLEAELADAKEDYRDISERQLPEKMDTLGLPMFETATGISVKIKEKVRGSLNAENRPKGHAWLEANGFGGMIKSNVVVPFKRDQIDEANELVSRLQKENRQSVLERKVEASTLAAFIREQLAAGKDIPLDTFSVFRQRVAEVEV